MTAKCDGPPSSTCAFSREGHRQFRSITKACTWAYVLDQSFPDFVPAAALRIHGVFGKILDHVIAVLVGEFDASTRVISYKCEDIID